MLQTQNLVFLGLVMFFFCRTYKTTENLKTNTGRISGLAVNLKTVKIMEHLQWLTSPILWNVPCKMTTQFTQELAMFKVKNMIENHQDLKTWRWRGRKSKVPK